MSKPLTSEQILTLLAEAPPRIAALTANLTTAQLQTRPAPDEWSANEVLAHLRSCSDMWGQAMMDILSKDSPTFKAVNPRTWIKSTNYPEQEFQPSLDAFTTQRTELLAILKPLSPESWLRSGTVSVAGKPLERTVMFYANWLATHERPHIRQIANTVKMVQGNES